jgi:carbonic anhydrase/acetyltransferase-like protein (isoleucine patch superfamily)
MPLLSLRGFSPKVASDAFVAPDAQLIGRVTVGAGASVWYQVVARADLNAITIGERSNIQDGTILHLEDDSPCAVGREVVVGHRAVLHGCTVGDRSLIGIGAILLTGSVIGAGAMVGAGSVVPQGMRIRPGWLALGVPAREIRELKPEEKDGIQQLAEKYCGVALEFRQATQQGARA